MGLRFIDTFSWNQRIVRSSSSFGIAMFFTLRESRGYRISCVVKGSRQPTTASSLTPQICCILEFSNVRAIQGAGNCYRQIELLYPKITIIVKPLTRSHVCLRLFRVFENGQAAFPVPVLLSGVCGKLQAKEPGVFGSLTYCVENCWQDITSKDKGGQI